MCNKKTASVDVGNKNVKVMMDGLTEPFIFSNILKDVVSNSSEKNVFSAFKQTSVNPANLLDLTINSNSTPLGRKYFGGLALKHGGEVRPLKSDKSSDDDILFSALASLGYLLYDPNNPIKEYSISLGSCLPIKEYTTHGKEQLFCKKLSGKHEVVFNHPLFNNGKVTINIIEGDVLILPEGVAACLNIMFDDNCNYHPEYEKLEDIIIIIVDIGGGTIDITAIQNLDAVEELTDHLDKGILYAEENIIKAMKFEKPDYSITKAELDYYIRKKNCKLIDGEDTWDVSDIVTAEFEQLSKDIAQKINDIIRKMPDTMHKNLGRIILTGGTMELLENYLKPWLTKYKVVVSQNGLYDNVLGTYKTQKASAAQPVK